MTNLHKLYLLLKHFRNDNFRMMKVNIFFSCIPGTVLCVSDKISNKVSHVLLWLIGNKHFLMKTKFIGGQETPVSLD